MSIFEVLQPDDPKLVGNWYPFPPPEKGIYDLRRARLADNVLDFQYYANRRVYEGGQARLLCMGRRVTRMRADEGWQFRFRPQFSDGVPVNWRPMALIYDFPLVEGPVTAGVAPRLIEKRDVSNQLPFARSVEEARHIIRSIPERYPLFQGIHIEYTEEKVSG